MRAFLLAIAAIVFLALIDLLKAQPPAEGSLGTFPLPEIVGMSGDTPLCTGYTLSQGKLQTQEHLVKDGHYFITESFWIHSIPARPQTAYLNEFTDREVKIILVPVEPRTRKEIAR